MAETRILTNRRGQSLQSDMTNQEALEAALQLEEMDEFLLSLLSQATERELSSEQYWWLHKRVLDNRAKTIEVNWEENYKQSEGAACFPAIRVMMDKAKQMSKARQEKTGRNVKPPKLHYRSEKDREIIISYKYEEPNIYTENWVRIGTLKTEFGWFVPSEVVRNNPTLKERQTTKLQLNDGYENLGEIFEDFKKSLYFLNDCPQEAAKNYGRLTGRCCFCQLPLTRSESIAAGYGPVCAGNYGLQWGVEKLEFKDLMEEQS
jgi:hypothetical protein